MTQKTSYQFCQKHTKQNLILIFNQQERKTFKKH